jgi:hypothetical protein
MQGTRKLVVATWDPRSNADLYAKMRRLLHGWAERVHGRAEKYIVSRFVKDFNASLMKP